MVLKSTVTVARPGANSLRTTIPQGCVEYLKVENGDGLLWEMGDGPGGIRMLFVRKEFKGVPKEELVR